ncbi:MAG: hypothetical protein ACFB0B_02995 [Thermonemataceae bacterium]
MEEKETLDPSTAKEKQSWGVDKKFKSGGSVKNLKETKSVTKQTTKKVTKPLSDQKTKLI